MHSVQGSLRLERKLIGRAEQPIPGQTMFGKLGRQVTNPRGSICQWAPGSQLLDSPSRGMLVASTGASPPAQPTHLGHCCTALVAHVGHRGSGNGHYLELSDLGTEAELASHNLQWAILPHLTDSWHLLKSSFHRQSSRKPSHALLQTSMDALRRPWVTLLPLPHQAQKQ